LKIIEGKEFKRLVSDDFNFIFHKESGYTETWGATREEDPEFCQYGPLIADIEISTKCSEGCKFCYKANTSIGENMSFETFKNIFHKFPRTLTQIAFGVGDIDGNPDMKKIFDYCKNNDYQYIVPNVTINGSRMTPEWYDYLAETMGAVAISHYSDDKCFNSVKELTDRGMTQVNIHKLLSEDIFESCMNLIDKVKTDPRLENLNAVVFLRYKPKGRNKNLFKQVTSIQFKQLIEKCELLGVKVGMDSCSSKLYMDYIENNKSREDQIYLSKCVEPCESFGVMSSYINTQGIYFPCSFCEGELDWKQGINLNEADSFIKDVWFNPLLNKYRELSIKDQIKYKSNITCRKCLIYEELNK
jgi:MoaA/NifB/PqqE/SkfB family radical SAM enzyme